MRIAKPSDFSAVKEMVLEFIESTEHIKKYHTEEYIDALLNSMLSAPTNTDVILISDDGFIAGKAVPFPFGPSIVATELGWYIRPDSRGNGKGTEFLDAFEYWAKHVAICDLVNMSSIDDKVGEYLKGKGYELSERAYIKEL